MATRNRRYVLERDRHGCHVSVFPDNGAHPYDLWAEHERHFGAKHSPTGFEWGYGGSGPAETARAIVSDFLGREAQPDEYQPFKWAHIAGLPEAGGELWFLGPEDRSSFTCVMEDPAKREGSA